MEQSAKTSNAILDPRVQSQKRAFAREFQAGDPFPHVLIEDFFSPEMAKRLLDDFPRFEERFARGEMGDVGRKAARRDVRNISEAYREIDDFIQTSEFLDLMSEITQIPSLIYDSEYHGGGTHENLDHASLYPHVDFNYHPKGWHRRLNLIVYLNPAWEEAWGGNLELHTNPWNPVADCVKTVTPRFNYAVLFETSERSWHGFRRIHLPEDRRHLSRKSFAIYLYTNDRPAEQTAASHSTVYVPLGMPEDVEPGQPLTQEQYQLLKGRFDELREMLRYQYDRQLRLSEDFAAVYRLDLQGYAVQTRAPTGLWPDGWASSDLSVEFTATRPLRGILLGVVVPEKLGSDQILQIRAGDWSGVERLRSGEKRILELPIRAQVDQPVKLSIHASATWTPGDEDTRELAYLISSTILED